MTTSYEFAVAYKKLGVATAPSSAPTITIVDSANNLLANAQATTLVSNLTSVYRYSYSGTDGLTLYALFHTSDATVDEQDIFDKPNINPVVRDIQTRIPAALTANGNIKASLLEMISTSLSETSTGYLAAGLKKLLDVAAPVFTLASVNQTYDVWNAATTSLTTVGSIGKLLVTNVNATISSRGSLGAGSTSTSITINDGSNPIDGVDVWITTDSAGTNTIARGTTNASGVVTFLLDAGTYYVWKQRTSYNFGNPDTLTVT